MEKLTAIQRCLRGDKNIFAHLVHGTRPRCSSSTCA